MVVQKNHRGKKMTGLHILLTDCFPKRETVAHGILDVPWLARKLKMTEEGIYQWIRRNRLPVSAARRIVAIPECEYELEAFLDFLA